MRIIAIAVAGLVGWAGPAVAQDVTAHLETVARAPCAASRPVLRAHDGRIRIALRRGGQIEVSALDPRTAGSSVEARLNAAGATFLASLGGALFLGTRGPGGLYRGKGSVWKSVAGLPPSHSVVALLGLGSKRYALLRTAAGGMVARSGPRGSSWEVVMRLSGETPLSLVPLATEPYVFTSSGTVYVGEAEGFRATKADLFPRVKEGKGVLVAHRSLTHGGETLYLGARVDSGGSWRPAGLFAGSTPHAVRRIILHGMTIRDILSTGRRLYVLATSKQGPRKPTKSTIVERYGPDSAPRPGMADGGAAPVDGGTASSDGGAAAPDGGATARPATPPVWTWVVASSNLMVWEDILTFRTAHPAHSFAHQGGDFYFALGCEPGRTPSEPTRVVRVTRRRWKQWRKAWIY